MPRLRVSVVMERKKADRVYGDVTLASIRDFDTGLPILDIQSFVMSAAMGGGMRVTGPLPYFAELRGEITYWDSTDSGKTVKQTVEIAEMTIRTVNK